MTRLHAVRPTSPDRRKASSSVSPGNSTTMRSVPPPARRSIRCARRSTCARLTMVSYPFTSASGSRPHPACSRPHADRCRRARTSSQSIRSPLAPLLQIDERNDVLGSIVAPGFVALHDPPLGRQLRGTRCSTCCQSVNALGEPGDRWRVAIASCLRLREPVLPSAVQGAPEPAFRPLLSSAPASTRGCGPRAWSSFLSRACR